MDHILVAKADIFKNEGNYSAMSSFDRLRTGFDRREKSLLLTFSVVTAVIGVRTAINRRASEPHRMNPA